MNSLWSQARREIDHSDGFTSLVYNRFRVMIATFREFQQEPLRLVWYIHKGDDHYQRLEHYDP